MTESSVASPSNSDPGGLDAEAAAVVAARTSIPAADLNEARSKYETCGARFGPAVPADEVITSTWVDLGADGRVGVRIYKPFAGDESSYLLWAHGGGWTVGSARGFGPTAAALAVASAATVVSVDYSLAPENPFPRAVVEVAGVLEWVLGGGLRGVRGEALRVVVGGDSAGANLILGAQQITFAADHPGPTAQVLVYPVTDPRMDTPSYRLPSPTLSRDALGACWQMYAGTTDLTDSRLSPIDADPTVAPTTLLVSAGQDILVDDGKRYATHLRNAGTLVVECEYPDMPHGFLEWSGAVERSREAVRRIGEFVRAANRTDVES